MANASTVKEFSERYFAEVIAKERKDATQLRRYLEKEIYPAFGNRPIREITAQDVQRLVFRKRDNGFESAAAQLRNLLKRILITRWYAVWSLQTLLRLHRLVSSPMQGLGRGRSRQMRSPHTSRCSTAQISAGNSN